MHPKLRKWTHDGQRPVQMLKMLHENDTMHTAKMNASNYSDCWQLCTCMPIWQKGNLLQGKDLAGYPLRSWIPLALNMRWCQSDLSDVKSTERSKAMRSQPQIYEQHEASLWWGVLQFLSTWVAISALWQHEANEGEGCGNNAEAECASKYSDCTNRLRFALQKEESIEWESRIYWENFSKSGLFFQSLA